MYKKIGVMLCAVVFLLGCEKIFPKKAVEVQKTAQKLSIKGPLLAQVDDWALGLGDFRDKLEALKTLQPQMNIEDPKYKKNILQELINLEIIAQEAKKRGLDRERDFLEALEDFKRSLLVQKMNEQTAADVAVTDVEAQNFYDTNKLGFTEPEERKIREIVVSTEVEAKDIMIRLLQGEDFVQLAKERSIAATKNAGGDLGYLKPDPKQKFQKFWEESFTKAKGQTSSYFKGEDGNFYIVKVEDIKGGKARPFAEVKEDIKKYLRQDAIGKKIEELISKARQKMKIVINQDLLDN